jgi:hypothetical protein
MSMLTDSSVFGSPQHDRFQYYVQAFHCNFRLTSLDQRRNSLSEIRPIIERSSAQEAEKGEELLYVVLHDQLPEISGLTWMGVLRVVSKDAEIHY